MASKEIILQLRDALRLANCADMPDKLAGINRLAVIVSQQDKKFVELGYDQVLLKELMKFIKFEHGDFLRKTMDILANHYLETRKYQDEIMGVLLYRYGLSTDIETSVMCLDKISELMDHMGDDIAKHSKQLLQLADISCPTSVSERVETIMLKAKSSVPRRRNFN